MTKLLRIAALFALDAACVNISYFLAYLLRFELDMDAPGFDEFYSAYTDNFIWLTAIKLVLLFAFGMYNSLWKYAGAKEMAKVLAASVFATLGAMAFLIFFQTDPPMPRSVYAITFLFDTALFGGVRFAYRYARELRGGEHPGLFSVFAKEPVREGVSRVLLVGAGDAGASIIREIRYSPERHMDVVAVIDDDASKRGHKILGVKIEGGREDIPRIIEKHRIEEIIIAIPSATRREIKGIVEQAAGSGAKMRILPSLMDLIDEKVSVSALRDLDIEDLLGREPVELDTDGISGYLSERVVLVTGGGGSIGSELCRQIAAYGPKKLIALDIYENTVFELANELDIARPGLDFEPVIASVTDGVRMRRVFAELRPQVVFHAAAHKHVPLMEFNPAEAVVNNVLGTKIVCDLAAEFGAGKLVMISTDKAVNPENVMGATKRLAEMVLTAADADGGILPTTYAAVRFGNVLGSNGSVVPIFRKQIARGGPVTVTDKDITRYFMTIPEAVQLVIQAGAMMSGGEIFILDMGEPVRILDLAKNIIRLSGFAPHDDIEIVFTGLRPGEKLHEELSYGAEDIGRTAHDKIFLGKAMNPSEKMAEALNADGRGGEAQEGSGAVGEAGCENSAGRLEQIIRGQVAHMSDEEVKRWLREYLPEYGG
ncbi:MAG: polysaccharide biosynthesis protein [Clostridiales Family XIII bacterium]|nr:polysaccharide biosynthesis protein [Clostridiales Family XIII bacterium]